MVLALRIFWVILISWFEHGTFIYTASQCSWPTFTYDSQLPKPTHVLIVADPQILDQGSYPDRGALLTFLSRIFTDLNLRRSWRAALRKRPDAVVFLGDMMDNGRIRMTDIEYERYYLRFNSIFVLDDSIPRYFVPGNHDTGLGTARMFSPRARYRYLEHFGPPNYVKRLSEQTLVFIDAPGLVDEEYNRTAQAIQFNQWKPVAGGPVEFIHTFAKNKTEGPVILFTHIPLARPEGMDCGPLRERGTIHRGGGLGYQNTLGKQMTHFLLDKLHPSIIFSGDDHDYCEYTHILDSSTRIREVTVKSLSMAMGIRRPGFQMLSLVPPSSLPEKSTSHADAPCVMPDQLGIYLSVYLPLIVVSLLVLFLLNAFFHFRRSPDLTSLDVGSMWTTAPGPSRNGRPRGESQDDNGLPTPAMVAKRRHAPFGLRAQSRLWNRFEMFAPRSGFTTRRRWWLAGFVYDVWDVAVVALGVFVLLSVISFW